MVFNLYKPGVQSKDYLTFDRVNREIYQAGGTLFTVYRYKGPADDQGNLAGAYTDILDKVLLENSKRSYDRNPVEIWGHYQMQDSSWDLMQFGVSLAGTNTQYVTTHYNDMMERIGRKVSTNDIVEVQHLRDTDPLNPDNEAMNRFYVVLDSDRPAEGFGPSWRSHTWRIRMQPLTDSPEFKDILQGLDADGNDVAITGKPTLQDILSSYDQELSIMDSILEEADTQVKFTGSDTHHLWVDITDDGKVVMYANAGNQVFNGDGIPPNANPEDVQYGSSFPGSPSNGTWFLRTDYTPARLFRYESGVWYHEEQQFRREWTGAHKNLSDIINTTGTVSLPNGEQQQARQSLREAVKAKSEFKRPQDV